MKKIVAGFDMATTMAVFLLLRAEIKTREP